MSPQVLEVEATPCEMPTEPTWLDIAQARADTERNQQADPDAVDRGAFFNSAL